MEGKRRVKDLMVPLHEYAVVEEHATLLEALRALEAAQENLPAGRHLHRALLVRRGGEIVGRLGHLAFLEALLRHGEAMFHNPLIDAAGVSDELVRTSIGHLRALASGFGGLCERGRHIRVGEVMRPAALRIDAEAPLREAIAMLTGASTLALLVTRGPNVIGVLRSGDVFAEMSRRMHDCSSDEE